ncbi:MAG: hypothetical protein RLY32_2479, partial [Pseudomonadota bacterium]
MRRVLHFLSYQYEIRRLFYGALQTVDLQERRLLEPMLPGVRRYDDL